MKSFTRRLALRLPERMAFVNIVPQVRECHSGSVSDRSESTATM